MAQLKEEEIIIGDDTAIESRLQMLVQENRISDIECRIIRGAIQSDQQIAELYHELTSKNDEASLIEILDMMSRNLHLRNDAETEDDPAQNSNKESVSEFDQQRNPLLNDLVIENLFQFLPLSDILQCRLVNRKWNKEAESILHKTRAKIFFKSAEQSPSKFCCNSLFSDQKNPFHDFTFLPCPNYNGGKWPIAELSQFFENWGDKVEKLKLENIALDTPIARCRPYGLCYLHAYNMKDWISWTPNLTHLDIKNCEESTTLIVNLNQLIGIRFISLSHCYLDPRNWENNAEKIRPSVLTLENVTFQLRDHPVPIPSLNDFFELDTATSINLSNNRMNYQMSVLRFIVMNMAAHVFNTDMFICGGVILENWELAQGSIKYFYLKDFPLENNTFLQIKQICIRNPEIDLSGLPTTVEKLNLFLSDLIMRSVDEVQLPNLTSLHFIVNDQNHCVDALNYFSNFPSIVDLRFEIDKIPLIVDMSIIPTSVKRVKIITTKYFDFQEDWNPLRQLESLILENYACRLNEVAEMLQKIKTKVLVISWNGKGTLKTDDIIDFVRLVNHTVEKIIIGTIGDEIDLHGCNTPSEQNSFFVFVDQKKANHYLFENKEATPLTLAEFEEWAKMDDAFEDCI